MMNKLIWKHIFMKINALETMTENSMIMYHHVYLEFTGITVVQTC